MAATARRKTTVLQWARPVLAAWLVVHASGQAAQRQPAGAMPSAEADHASLPSAEELHAVEVDPQLLLLIQRLDDPSYAQREEATARLLDPAFDDIQLYAVLSRNDLSTEQRHRVLTVVRQRLLDAPRGAVGIRADRRWFPLNRIVVEELLPDLPAREVLQIGDRITRLDGRPIESWDHFLVAVQSRRPGERITLTIERLAAKDAEQRPRDEGARPPARTMTVALVLGSAELLRDPYTGEPQPAGPVARVRQETADDALARFGPRAKLIEIRTR